MATPTAIPVLISRTPLRKFRLIPRIETFPAVITFAQTLAGKTLLLVAFGLGLYYFIPDLHVSLQFMLLFSAITFLPSYRRFILALATICVVIAQDAVSPLTVGLKLCVMAIGIFLFWAVRRWPRSWFARNPIAILLSAFTVLILIACTARQDTALYHLLWPAVEVSAAYVWFLAYALIDKDAKPPSDTSLELASFRPLWGSTNVPFPKGAAYLRRIEARDDQQFAIVQLKGLKLLVWAILLQIFSVLWYRFFHLFLGVPTSTDALTMFVRGVPVAWTVRWESQLLAFFESILGISILGHRIIACCRMAGFNALRNTYRPLSSRTVAEFFNRYYFYFKELLVDFFFYPTFLRYWKGKPQMRIIFATFSAAFLGNAFFHFTRDWFIIRDQGLREALVNFQVFFFYTFVLALGLTISQLRNRNPRPAGFVRGRLLPAISVCMFYCLLDIFAKTERNYPLIEHLRYFGSLFFIHF